MDLTQFNSLAKLVKQARIADKIAFEKMQEAIKTWKEVNESLTEKMEVLDLFVFEEKADAIRLEEEND
jgi:hypothetical protein